ncbi:MAG: alpha-amylase family glycosyl hydrolase [Bacteroidota bacterium]
MKKLYWIIFFFPFVSMAQKVTLDPTISPALFRYNDAITVTYDVTGTSLSSLTNAYAWVWIPGRNINAKYNITPASNDPTKTNNAKFTKSVEGGKTLFKLTFTPSAFFDGDISADKKLGILLKGNDWSNGQTTDYLADFWDGSFQIKLTSPAQPVFVDQNDDILIQAETPVTAHYELFINNVLVNSQDAASYTYTHTVTESSGYATVKLTAFANNTTKEVAFQYIISGPSPVEARPTGVIPGINYSDDKTKVTLCLWAPGKSSVYAVGDFSNWDILAQNLMKKDGEHFWIELTGLTSGQEYAYQYLVDESIRIADPYADKILDPDDQYIPASTYPNLKSFPAKALTDKWYFNRAAVFQTNQAAYNWQASGYQRPKQENLVIYELLVRDYFANGQRNYQNLIDTLSYLTRLGVNAIELMPIMEFNGNESWGYNPAFMFAPDKYYGTKNKFKEFIDKCHQNGIAVILDIAMNHQDMPNPYVMLDFDFANGKPEPDNKWFNVSATHPFSVFFDMNHESTYTKKYLDTVNYYWLNEYKIDGFRFDLSKGFTQVNNPSNVGAWSAYDVSRINILKRMADKIWAHTPDAYIILEHLSENSEEKELAEYRAAEGKGMMLWGKMTDPYNQNTMGFAENNDITGIYHTSRGWSVPHLVGYMESHDEERLMYKNVMFGSKTGTYNVKDTVTALARMRAANTIFFTIPGPKMLWQFGEVGYGFSINHCPDGTNNQDCRVSPKPVRWNYRNDPHRLWLYDHIRDLNRLRKNYDVFTDGAATISTGNGLSKQVMLKNNPYNPSPTSTGDMNAVVVANFDLVSKSVSVQFPHAGTWYDYYEGGAIVQVTGAAATISLPAGGYKLFTDVLIESTIITSSDEPVGALLSLYPNPVEQKLVVRKEGAGIRSVSLYNGQGVYYRPERMADDVWQMEGIPSGLYIIVIHTSNGIVRSKVVKR